MADLTPAGRLDVTEVLRTERAAFLALLSSLDGDEWQRPTECPAWTVKGVALHILGDDLSLLSRQRDEATPGTISFAVHHPGLRFRQLLDGFNEQWVTAAAFLSGELIIELLRLSGDWTADYYSHVDPEALGEPVGFFGDTGPSPYWRIAAREYVERWVHQNQIRRAVGRPELDDEFLAPAAAAVVRALVAYLSDLGAADGTTLGLGIPDLAEWTLVRQPERWVLFDGAAGDASATLMLDRSAATVVLSRGLPRQDVPASFTVAGTDALGGQAVSAIAAIVGSNPAG